MKITTNDGTFSITITSDPLPSEPPDRRFFTLSLALGDRQIGSDTESAIIAPDLVNLHHLYRIDDPRLDPVHHTANELRDTIEGEVELNSKAMTGLGELFDKWVKRAYQFGDTVVFLFNEAENDWPTTSPHIALVPAPDFFDVVRLAQAYHDLAFRGELGRSRPTT